MIALVFHKRRGNSSSNESDFSCYWRGGPHVLTWPLGHVKFAISRMFYRVSSIRILKWMWTHQFSFCNSIVIFIKIIHLHVSRNPVSRKSSTLLKASSRVHHTFSLAFLRLAVCELQRCRRIGGRASTRTRIGRRSLADLVWRRWEARIIPSWPRTYFRFVFIFLIQALFGCWENMGMEKINKNVIWLA